MVAVLRSFSDQCSENSKPNGFIVVLIHEADCLSSVILQRANVLPSYSRLSICIVRIHPDPNLLVSTLYERLTKHRRN